MNAPTMMYKQNPRLLLMSNKKYNYPYDSKKRKQKYDKYKLTHPLKGRPSCEELFLKHIELIPFTDCWVWTGSLTRHGYGSVCCKGYTLAHRLSYFLHYNINPEKMFVCHKCDNKMCVNPDHLFLGTHQDNMIDMANKGRALDGEKHPKSKITYKDAENIRKEYVPGSNPRARDGVSAAKLAKKYGITRSVVLDIVKNKRFKTR